MSSQPDVPEANANTERTPLLASVATEPVTEPATTDSTDGVHAEDENAPLPKVQILLLSYTRIIEPIAFFSIFPYIASMIEDVSGKGPEEAGFYAGLIESLFSLTQMFLMVFWGRASDRYGRKPVLVFSLVGIAVATTLFGMSQSIWQMIVTRCIAGVFGGTVVTLRTMFSEVSTKRTQAKAFSYFAFAGNLGILLGPLLGAAFERPAEKYPRVFDYRFFRDYPFALPGIVISALTLIGALLTIFFIKETYHVDKDKKKNGEVPTTIRQLLNFPGVIRVLAVNQYIALLAFTFTAVNPVFLHVPVVLGGLGLSDELIAAVIGFSGASQAAWLLLVFPALHKRLGSGQVLRLAACVWPLFFAMHPLFNVLLRFDEKVAFWVMAPPALALGSGVAMAFTAIQLAVNDIAPSPETFGTLNAIVLAASAGMRSVMPALATSVYAVGVKYHILWGQLFWVFEVAIGVGLFFVLRILPEKAAGKPTKRTASED
ncbi:hypothetical protein E8E13_007573 [Curvularia kusanoi]|uniref:Major facilitator superfamily (MFS) profile domain-containing protein n=1 Tax=Curvularia kusanoi TaxID=90978 RepID=A0A9P4TFR9_CURKU|nr:hypothetical protein E8E13_007573 [Curvularia kusanoi]